MSVWLLNRPQICYYLFMNHRWSNPCRSALYANTHCQMIHNCTLQNDAKNIQTKPTLHVHCEYEKQCESSKTWSTTGQLAFHAASARQAPTPLTPNMVDHIQIPHLREKAGDRLIVCSAAFYTSRPSVEKQGKRTLWGLILCTRTWAMTKAINEYLGRWKETKKELTLLHYEKFMIKLCILPVLNNSVKDLNVMSSDRTTTIQCCYPFLTKWLKHFFFLRDLHKLHVLAPQVM